MKYMWKHTDGKLVDVEEGIKRRCLARSEDMLTVYYEFTKGGGSIDAKDFHSHEHAQVTYIMSGKFIFNVNGKEFEVVAGDSLINPPNLPHTAVCIEDGTLIDVFNPNRPGIIPVDEKDL